PPRSGDQTALTPPEDPDQRQLKRILRQIYGRIWQNYKRVLRLHKRGEKILKEMENIKNPTLGDIGRIGRKILEIRSKSGKNRFEGHHLLVQAYRRAFEELGINIDRFIVFLRRLRHRGPGRHKEWSDPWRQYMKKNEGKKLNELDVMRKLLEILK